MRDNPSDTATLVDDEEPGSAAEVDDSRDADDDPSRRIRLRVPASRRGKTALAAVLVLVIGAAAAVLIWVRLSGLPDGAAFAFDDHVVTRADLDKRGQALEALYGVVAPDEPAKRDAFRRDLAKSVAVSMILDDAAKQRRIVVADKQARDVLDRYVTSQFGDEGRAAFARALGNVGTSERAVLDEIKRQLAVGRLMDQVVGDVSIDEDALRAAFAKRKTELGVPERRAVRNIVVAQRNEAREVLGQLRSGVSFEKVAAARSLDGSTRESGGRLGELSRDELEPAVADAVFGIAPGQLYGPVKGEFGWNVGRVDRVEPPEPARYDDVEKTLKQTLTSEESLRRWREWLAQRIREAGVEYADEFQPADPDAPPTLTGRPGEGGPR